MKITVLGCGSSVGVPVIGCSCDTCLSYDTRNKRYRTCAMIKTDSGKSVLIDTSSDFKWQALVNGFSAVSDIIYTHIHSDHTSGIHDLRMFDAESSDNIIKIWSDESTISGLSACYPNLFDGYINPEKRTKFQCEKLEYYRTCRIADLEVLSFPQNHGKIVSNGLRFGKVAYCTDLCFFSEEAINLLMNVELLFIECLGLHKKIGHLSFDDMVAAVKRIKPKKVVTIHMGHTIDYISMMGMCNRVFSNDKIDVIPGYDGLTLEI